MHKSKGEEQRESFTAGQASQMSSVPLTKHVAIKAPAENAQMYWNHKQQHSFNVQVSGVSTGQILSVCLC